MKKIALFLIFLVLACIRTFGQAEASNWYFGENAGINFNIFTGEVTPLTDGKLFTREGCASISNSNGELLFYTDGTTVYNASHEVMENGKNLYGDDSSTQSAIVVPSPGDPNLYFIFTVGSNQTNTGLNYSIVDMFANNGLGRVMFRNLNLLPQCAEKIAAVVKDCETRSIWVITLSSESGFFGNQKILNTFYAYEVGPTGVNETPVKSTLPINVFDVRGYLKLSPSGKKLACASVHTGGLYLFDFDSETGSVTNPQTLNINDQSDKPYGLEFSANSDILYVTSSNDYFNGDNPLANNDPSNHTCVLLQYDLTAPNITDSQFVLDSRNNYRGALQLGPNGKIYRSLSSTYDVGINKLGVINQPNELGLNADYRHNAVDLGTNASTQGLPPFIASFFNEQIDIIKNDNDTNFLALCAGESYTLTADEIIGGTYTWTKDGVLLPENDFDLEVSETGVYKVTIEPPGEVETTNCGFPQGEARVEVFEYPEAIKTSLSQCDLDLSSYGITTFNLKEAYEMIANGSNDNNTITFHASLSDAMMGVNAIANEDAYTNTVPNETIYVRNENDFTGCFVTSNLELSVSNTQVPRLKALPVCDDIDTPDGLNLFNLENHKAEIIDNLNLQNNEVNIKFYETEEDGLLEINEINEYRNKTPYNQIIFYRVDTQNNACYGINEYELVINKLPKIQQQGNQLYCLNNFPATVTINAGLTEGSPSDFDYLWNNGATTYEIEINEIGTYSVSVTNQAGCSDQRTVTVQPSNLATINNIEVTDVSENNIINVMVSGEGTYQFALTDSNNQIIYQYQDSPIFENIYPGLYTINIKDIKNDCGVIYQPVSVIGFPKFFTPNDDGMNDTWQVYGVAELFQPDTKIQIFNRYGRLIKELDPLGNGWNGSIRGKKLPNDDYWFSVKLQDGRIFKNHFTLKH